MGLGENKVRTRSSSNALSSSSIFFLASEAPGMGFKPRNSSTTFVFQNVDILCRRGGFCPSQCLLLSRIFCEVQSLATCVNTHADESNALGRVWSYLQMFQQQDSISQCRSTFWNCQRMRDMPAVLKCETKRKFNCWLQIQINYNLLQWSMRQ